MTGPPRLARTAGLISSATLFSRLLGLAREQLFAGLLGATLLADAFKVAFRIPNLLRDLFAEGALSQAFVPTFKTELKQHGPARAYVVGNLIAGNLLCIVGAIVLLAGVFTPAIVDAMASDFALVAGKRELTIDLTRIMLPFLLLISLAAVAMGMLNAQDRFVTPALAPAMFNVMSILCGVVLWLAGVDGRWVAIGWAIGTLLGGLAQLGIQTPSLLGLGFRPRPRLDLGFRDPSVRRVARLMGPAVAGLAAVQVNIFVNTWFASSEPGAVSWLDYAFRFLQLPIGVFGVAISVVATTRFADAAADADPTTMARHLLASLRLVLFLTVPATVGLWLLGTPILRLIYEHGEFGPVDTVATARALELYILGLVAYAGVKVVAPAFYAADAARIPMLASMLAVAANLALNFVLHPVYGYRILALGTATAALFNFGVLYALFHRRIAPIAHGVLAEHIARVGAAAAVMGVAVWGAHRALVDRLGETGLAVELAVTLAPIAGGILVYVAACRALRIAELDELLARVRKAPPGPS
jgi:putative peptidoglycan lipid II flippase